MVGYWKGRNEDRSAKNPEPSKALLQPGGGQNVALRASHTAGTQPLPNFCLPGSCSSIFPILVGHIKMLCLF